MEGWLLIKLRDRHLRLEEGESVIVSKGVEHHPIAEEQANLLVLEPESTLNTGNVHSDRTVQNLEKV